MIVSHLFKRALGPLALSTVTTLAACVDDKDTPQEGASFVYQLSESGSRPVPEVRDFRSAEQYAAANGFYDGKLCTTSLAGNEQVSFSASYETEGEEGQAYGHLITRGNKILYVQDGQPTTQAMLAPGLGGFEGLSGWEFRRYMKTICSVAFGKGVRGPDYHSISATLVSVTGGTAGQTVAYNDALKFSLSKQSNGGRTDVIFVFVRGRGPRIMEFREDIMPAGVAKVYIGEGGGTIPGRG